MNLTQNQRLVLMALTTAWQTPTQIAEQLSTGSEQPSDVNESLKALLQEGLVQANPIVLGTYRLTTLGTTFKTAE